MDHAEEGLRRAIFSVVLLLVLACNSTTPMFHELSILQIDEAISIAEELTWTQHQAFRPNDFAVTETFLAWNYGVVSRTHGIATAIGDSGIAVGSTSSTTRVLGDRAYYRSIDRAQLLSWMRKGRQWYAVSLVGRHGESKVIMRTQNLDDARLFVDAIETIVAHFKSVMSESVNP